MKLADRQQKELLRLSKQIGDKIGFAVIVPSCIFLIFLILSIEVPVFSIINDTSMAGGGM